MTALRVTNPEDLDGGQSEFHPMDADEYEALEALDLISFESTEIDGFSGEWIIYMITGEH